MKKTCILITLFFLVVTCNVLAGWKDITNGDFPKTGIMDMSVCMYKDTVYAAFCETNPGQVSMIKFDEKTGKWINLMDRPMQSKGTVSIAVNENGIYLAHEVFEPIKSTDPERIRFYKLNEETKVLEEASAPHEVEQPIYMNLTFNGKTPHILYGDAIIYENGSDTIKPAVIRLDTETRKWKYLEKQYISQWDAPRGFLWFEDGKPYAGLGGMGGFQVIKYEGNKWAKTDIAAIKERFPESMSVNFYNGEIYVALGSELRVQKYADRKWVEVGQGLDGLAYGYGVEMCRDESTGDLYIAFGDNLDNKIISKKNPDQGRLTVMKCHDGTWSFLGRRKISKNQPEFKKIFANNGKVFVVYSEKALNNLGKRYTVKMFEGGESYLDRIMQKTTDSYLEKSSIDKKIPVKPVATPVKEAVKEAEFTKEQLEQYYKVYKNPFVKHVRKALNSCLDGDCKGYATLGQETEQYLEYFKSKFVVLSINKALMGGQDMIIIFQDKPDKVFYAWVYKLAGEEDEDTYELRVFQEYDKLNAKTVVKQFGKFINDRQHAL